MNNSPQSNPVTEPGTLRATLSLLLRFLPGDGTGFALGFVCVLGASAIALLQPWPLKLVFDSVLGSSEPPAAVKTAAALAGKTGLSSMGPKLLLLVALCVGLLVIELVLGAFHIVSAYLLNSVALRLVFKLRCALFDHVQHLSLRFHDSRAVGDSLYRITWDSYCIQ